MNSALPFKLRSDLTITPAIATDSNPDVYMIKQPSSGEIFELGKEEFFLAQCLDGQASLAEIVQRFGLEFGLSISEEYLQQFIEQIGDYGLLESLPSASIARDAESRDVESRDVESCDAESRDVENRNGRGRTGGYANGQTHYSTNSETAEVGSASAGVAYTGLASAVSAGRSFDSNDSPRSPTAVAVRGRDSAQTKPAFSSARAANFLTDADAGDDDLSLDAKTRNSDRWYWFNPTPLLRVIDTLFSPLRPFMGVLVWLLLPAILVGGTIFFKNQDLLWQDIERSRSPGSYIGTLLFHLVTINLASRLAIGTVCAHYGGEVKEFGLRLRFGLIPRFYIDASSANRFDRRAKLWTYGTALLLRITLFLVGIFTWIVFRGSSTQLAIAGISMAQAGFIGFIIVSAPVRASFGYRWFTTLIRQPANLLQRAFAVFGATIRRKPLPSTISLKSRFVLWMYALLLVCCWGFIAIKITTSIASGLNSTFPDVFGRATPFLLVAGVAFLFIRWFWDAKLKGLVTSKGSRLDDSRADGHSMMPVSMTPRSMSPRSMSSAADAGDIRYPWETQYPRSQRSHFWTSLRTPWFKRSLWLLALMGAVIFLMKPYPYRPGGAVQLIPPQQQQIQVPIAGQVTAVYFDGADGQWIEAGTPVALMAATNLQNDVATLKEEILEQQAEIQKEQSALAKVEAGPRPEAVEVARRQVAIAQGEVQEAQKQLEASEANRAIAQQKIETAQVQMPFRLAQVERFQSLYEEGVYSAQGVEEAQAQVDVTKEEVIEAQQAYNYAIKQTETAQQSLAIKQRELEGAQAELNLAQSGALPEDIEAATQEVNAAKAQLRALQQNLSHTQTQLQSTQLVMPIDGYLVTPYLKQQVGSYLEPGGTFATVQDNKVAIAELQLPEYDSGELTAGAAATVKLLAFPSTPISGEILAIEPTTSEELYGRILKILIRMDNSDQSLKAGMTGYAKIDAGEKSLFVLLTRPIVRFVQIELWSWLP